MLLLKPLLSLAASALIIDNAAGMYEKGSTVKPLSASNFDRILAKTSQPTFVKFYAPWCGHCQSLEPEYERAAKRTLGIAKFYAVNCDEDKNKPLCARYNVQGFPTLKVFTEKRTKRGTRRSVDYQGERKSSAMVKFARSLLPNLSRKLASDELDGFVASTELPKAVLLTDKKTTAELWKGVSAHFDRRVEFAQISSPAKGLLEKLGATQLPAIVVYPDAKDADRYEVYKGESKFLPLGKFIHNVAIAQKTKKTSGAKREQAASGDEASRKPVDVVSGSVDEITGQDDLEKLCIKPADDSSIPVVCIIGVLPLEPEFEESREEHAKALKQLEAVLRDQQLRSPHTPAAKSDNGDDSENEFGDDSDNNEKPKDEESLSAPLRVSWVNALLPVGQKIRTMFDLSDDLPSAVAISPRKSASAPYRGAFDRAGLLEWADACYQGRGMRRFPFDLDVSVAKKGTEKTSAHDEL